MEVPALSIRAASVADAEQLHAIHMHPAVYPQLLQLPYSTTETWVTRLQDTTLRHTLVAEQANDIVGCTGLRLNSCERIKHRGYLGMAVKYSHQGKGVGSALMKAVTDLADQWLNLKRLELTVYPDNEATIALYQKFGFEIEGELQDYAFRYGKFVNVYSMRRINTSC